MPNIPLIISDANRVTVRVWKPTGHGVSVLGSVAGVISGGGVGHVSLQTYGEEGIYASFWPDEPENKTAGRSRKLPSGVKGKNSPNLLRDEILESEELKGFDIRNSDSEELKNQVEEAYNENREKFVCAFIKFENGAILDDWIIIIDKNEVCSRVEQFKMQTNLSDNIDFNLVICKKRKPDFEEDIYLLSEDKIRQIETKFKEFERRGLNWSIFGSSIFAKENAKNCSGLVYHLLYEVGGLNDILIPHFANNTKRLSKIAPVALSPFFAKFPLRHVENAQNIVSSVVSHNSSINSGFKGWLAGYADYIGLGHYLRELPQQSKITVLGTTITGDKKVIIAGIFMGVIAATAWAAFSKLGAATTGGVIDTYQGIGFILTPEGIIKLTNEVINIQQAEYSLIRPEDNENNYLAPQLERLADFSGTINGTNSLSNQVEQSPRQDVNSSTSRCSYFQEAQRIKEEGITQTVEKVQQLSLQELPLSEQANRVLIQELNDESLQKGLQTSLRPM